MAEREIYSNTCFIDKNNQLVGELHLDNGVTLDFNKECIFVEDVEQKLNSTYVRVLFEMVKRESTVFKYDRIYEIYLKYEESDSDNWDQTVKNFKCAINKFVDIETVRKEGYKVILPQKIKRLNNVDRDDVDIYDIPSLFKSEKTEVQIAAEKAVSETSKKFLHKGASALVTEPRDSVLFEMEKLSGVFNLVSEFQQVADDLSDYERTGSVVVDMYHYISSGCRNGNSKDILKIEGPLGSYKNRIMQYVYLMINKSDADILPFYIDIAHYERMAETCERITEDDFIRAFKEDLNEFKKCIDKDPQRLPLLLLDGIRDFAKGRNESLYYTIKDELKAVDCKLVACVDCDFTMNEHHKFDVHPLAPDDFMVNVRISSMNLYDKDGSIAFIKKSVDVFDVDIPENVPAEEIYDNLVRLNFISMDAYWLVSMLNKCWRHIVSKESNISKLYKAFCLSVVNDYRILESASELAFEFEFGTVDFRGENVYFDMRWRLIRKHRSILDYLIAMQYLKRLDELDFDIDTHKESVKKLSFFNMVLQKNITRFIIAALKGNDNYERKIMVIARKFYSDLSLFGKSELTFWMGRLNDNKRKEECVKLLKKYNNEELRKYQRNEFESSYERRDVAFLLRGINVSLIYENDEKAFVYYINSLLTDKTANDVNRGFHLEYYGDKPYIPNNALLDYKDDIAKGKNTLTVICLSLEKRIKNNEKANYVSVLEVMTLCNLIQARIEAHTKDNAMDVSAYIKKSVWYLEWMKDQKLMDKVPDIKNYFCWMLSKFSDGKAEEGHYQVSTYNKFSQACSVVRTGWVNNGIANPENIVEHMYSCWLIGMLYLPDECDEPEYDKNTILNMLLLHDLGETVTGDISRPEKKKNQEYYDQRERKEMQDLLFSGTYPSSADLSAYLKCWNDWDRKNNINCLIAKDIDNLQTTYKFCDYYLKNPGLFNEDGVRYWLADIDRIETDIGKKIMNTLVVTNPLFKDILKIREESNN